MNSLEANIRENSTKGQLNSIRNNGNVPAIIYGGKDQNQKIYISKKLLKTLIEKENFLSNIITLNVDGKSQNVLPREVKYHILSDEPTHVDFLRVLPGVKIKIEVPVKFINQEKSPGLKRGGVLNIVRRKVELNCPSEKIPESLTLDLDGIDIGESFKISSVKLDPEVVPYSNPNNYIKQSKKIAEDLSKTHDFGVVWGNQFDNTVNTKAHIETTANEIWSQTAGKVDGFTCAVGTGGTLAGVSIGLKNKNKNIKIALSDPMGSSLYSYLKNNKLESKGNSITEGIGTGRITKNFEKAIIDDAFQTSDEEALKIVYNLIEEQNIVLGGSSGINIAGAIKLAKKLGKGKTIITILCDDGRRYASKIFNKEFLRSKNLPIPKWL